MTFSLRRLFAVVTVACAGIGGIVAFPSPWLRVLTVILAMGVMIAIVFPAIRIIRVVALTFPLVCLVNGVLFLIALDYAFDGTGPVTMLCGPFAQTAAWPIVDVQNNVNLPGAWDTVVGCLAIVIAQTILLVLPLAIWQLYLQRKTAVSSGV